MDGNGLFSTWLNHVALKLMTDWEYIQYFIDPPLYWHNIHSLSIWMQQPNLISNLCNPTPHWKRNCLHNCALALYQTSRDSRLWSAAATNVAYEFTTHGDSKDLNFVCWSFVRWLYYEICELYVQIGKIQTCKIPLHKLLNETNGWNRIFYSNIFIRIAPSNLIVSS